MNKDSLAGAGGVRGTAVLIVLCMHSFLIFFPETKPYRLGTGKIGIWLLNINIEKAQFDNIF